jgi:hypothetical protein
MSGKTFPNWVALAALVALLGSVLAVKWLKRWLEDYRQAKLAAEQAKLAAEQATVTADTAKLLSLNSELDPSEEAFLSNGLKIEEPSIRIRAYLDLGEP